MKLIAEIGLNHNGNIDIAKKLIKISALAGFDYVKFQKREPDISTPEHMKNTKRTLWNGKEVTYLEYRKLIEFDRLSYIALKCISIDNNINMFASVWDMESAKFMLEFTNIVKIPSALIRDIGLLKYCNQNYEFKIMSTGMSTEKEIEKAVETLNPDVIMHTNSCYPSPHEELNLKYINRLIKKYPDKQIGYSGHEVNLQPTLSAVVLGATWIERHVTIDRYLWGSDQLASVEPEGMFKLKKAISQIETTLKGDCSRVIYESEKPKLNTLYKKDYLELK